MAHFTAEYTACINAIKELELEPTIDKENKKIILNTNDIIKLQDLFPSREKNDIPIAEIVYNAVDIARKDIKDLEAYYTPILRDYTLVLITTPEVLIPLNTDYLDLSNLPIDL